MNKAIVFLGPLLLGWFGLTLLILALMTAIHLSAMFAFWDDSLIFPWHILRMGFAMSFFFGLFVGVLSLLGDSDSDGSPKGGDASGSVHDSAGLEGIGQNAARKHKEAGE